MKIHLISLGCAKNLVDSEKMLGALGMSGVSVSTLDDCDAVIINTCGFIQPALQETEQEIQRVASRMSAPARLYVYGCAVNRAGALLRSRHPCVTGWFRLDERTALLRALGANEQETAVRLPTTRGYAYLKIAEGCSNNCTYCTIPSIRGPYRSIARSALRDEAQKLAAMGYREIILIAQDTTRYGSDQCGRTLLPVLMRDISAIPSLRWLRLMYAHPASLSEDIIQEIACNEKVCTYLDLPIQHIKTRILRLMNRRVTQRQIMKLVTRLKKIKDISMRTTVITGFPGETDKEHKELVRFLHQGFFDWIGVFPYYKEQGTAAARRRGVADDVIEARYEELLNLQQELIVRQNHRRINRVYDVLIDRVNGRASGHTEFAAPEVDGDVIVAGSNIQPGQFYRTQITGCEAHTLFGTAVDHHAV